MAKFEEQVEIYLETLTGRKPDTFTLNYGLSYFRDAALVFAGEYLGVHDPEGVWRKLNDSSPVSDIQFGDVVQLTVSFVSKGTRFPAGTTGKVILKNCGSEQFCKVKCISPSDGELDNVVMEKANLIVIKANPAHVGKK